MEGGDRRGEGKGRRTEGGGGPAGPNSHAKMDFLLCPNCISTGSFFPKITGTNVPKIATKQPDSLPDKKENYPSAVRKSISQRPDDNNVPSVAIQILLAKGDQVFTRAAVSLGQDTHTQTHTRTHTHMHQRPLQYPLGFILASLYGT